MTLAIVLLSAALLIWPLMLWAANKLNRMRREEQAAEELADLRGYRYIPMGAGLPDGKGRV